MQSRPAPVAPASSHAGRKPLPTGFNLSLPSVLVGSLVRAEGKVVSLCIVTSLVLTARGGCWWPLQIVPDFAKMRAHCVPTGWAMDALNRLITFGGELTGAKLLLAVLCGFGLAANIAAARFFKT